MSRPRPMGEDEVQVHYGTPLEDQEDMGRRKGKLFVEQGQARQVAPWKQEVTDSDGRRRFHGAFTGGFSAGYYNTVGSKEGWAPTAFTSSRNQRAGKKEQLVYDFLDEDEKEEFKSKEVSSTAEFDTFGFTASELARRTAESEYKKRPSAIPGAIPDEIVTPSTQSIGVKLLVKMGWRQGRDIGADNFVTASAGNKGVGLGVDSLEKLDDGSKVGIRMDFGVQEEMENPTSSGRKRSKSEMLDKGEDCLPGFREAAHSSLDVQPLRFPSPLIPVDFTSKHTMGKRIDVKDYLYRPEPPEVPSPDMQLAKAIKGVAAFVARSGQGFEDMLKQKHVSNPQFAFLSGGPGHSFYLRKLWEEQQSLAKLGKGPIDSRPDSFKEKELLGDQRGRILGEVPMLRTETLVASSTTSSDEVSHSVSSLVPSEVVSDLSAQMSSRFTSGVSDTALGLVQGNRWDVVLQDSSLKDIPKLIGREESVWRPTAILCKRFNLLDPYVGQNPIQPKPRSRIELLNSTEELVGRSAEPSNSTRPHASSSKENHDTEAVGEVVLTENSIDLYKAIFSDDEDDDDEDGIGKPAALSGHEVAGGKVLAKKDLEAVNLNYLAAGDFLESLGKELGLRV